MFKFGVYIVLLGCEVVVVVCFLVGYFLDCFVLICLRLVL